MEGNNNLENEPVINQKEENNSKSNLSVILLVIACLIILALLAYILFFNKSVDEDKNQGTNSNNEELQEVDNRKLKYHIVDGEEYELYTDNTKRDETVSFDYPQFDNDIAELQKVNDEIQSLYRTLRDKLFSTISSATAGDYYVKKDGQNYGSMEIFLPSYNISETEDYLSIVIFSTRYCNCSGDISAYSYVVNKKTKKLMTNEEILGLFNVTAQDYINYYNQYGGCSANENNSISSLDNEIILIKDKELYFENGTCCCTDISKYGVKY